MYSSGFHCPELYGPKSITGDLSLVHIKPYAQIEGEAGQSLPSALDKYLGEVFDWGILASLWNQSYRCTLVAFKVELLKFLTF